ncbi:MAG: NAD+ synthase [Kiritimatiellae bacterium]|nr:NAD+ synthase [Kiritimatiellia bacterium]
MRTVRIALAQINPTVGALADNARRILRAAHQAAALGADLLATPELALCGYPPDDLVIRRAFLDAVVRTIRWLARALPRKLITIVGAPRPVPNHRPQNAAWVLQDGRLVGTYAKMQLPSGGVFDEERVFAPGERPLVLRVGPVRIALHICEDSWHPKAPACTTLRGAADLVLNMSASPFQLGKFALRHSVITEAAAIVGAPFAYVNLVGGQDELVFDGGSFAIDRQGRLVARARSFEEDLLLLDVPAPSPPAGAPAPQTALLALSALGRSRRRSLANSIAARPRGSAEAWAALRLALRDYVHKNGASDVVLGLSGGVDSALVAALAADALGARHVHALSMPTRFNSPQTQRDARRVAERLGLDFRVVPIEPMRQAVLEGLNAVAPGCERGLTGENLQARLRGLVLMAMSNRYGWLVLATGNKSEIATGYCTIYGDLVGAFAPLKDVPKTLVYRLARWRNRTAGREVVPASVLRRAPSAELRPNQTDQQSLPPYSLVDEIVERVEERDEPPASLVARGLPADAVRNVVRRIETSEYKRRQAPPGPKITPRAFGRDRRMPITCAWRAPVPRRPAARRGGPR